MHGRPLHTCSLFGSLFGALLAFGCGGADEPGGSNSESPGAPAVTTPWLVDRTRELGLPTDDPAWADGTYQLREMMGPGVGLCDLDGDGRLDILEPRCPPPDRWSEDWPNRAWRQKSDGTFEDATEATGLGDPGQGLAVACGDVDGDGASEVYFANFGRDAFYRNDGHGRFTEAGADARLESEAWTCSTAFLDHDRDGFLDLFLVNYVVHDEERECHGKSTAPEYCGPLEYEAAADALYRNDGNGHFEDVSRSSGIARPAAGLGLVCLDFNSDGWVDVYVANDAMANHLWINQQGGSFEDEAHVRGAGVNRHGKPEASMGVTAGDFDDDGSLDLFMTHLDGENNTLYVGLQAASWRDRSVQTKLSNFDRPFTGFGCGFADFDQDGWLDLAVVNGRVRRGPVHATAALSVFWNDYAEPNLLFRNRGDGSFDDFSGRAGAYGRRPDVGRGLALGDIDGDGDVDIVTSAYAGTLRVHINEAAAGHWLRVRARTGARAALGALVQLDTGDRTRLRACVSGFSYGSASEPVAHFGLGDARAYRSVLVRWPDGQSERFAGGDADREVVLVQGEGETP